MQSAGAEGKEEVSDVLADLRAAIEVANTELRRLAVHRPDLRISMSASHGPDDAPRLRLEVTTCVAVIGAGA